MFLYLFVFACLIVVTAMHIRIRDLEEEQEKEPGDPSPACGLVRDDSGIGRQIAAPTRETKGREDDFRG